MAVERLALNLLRPARFWMEGVSYRYSGRSSELAPLRDKYRSKPMLVVGNGPSLNKTPLDEFAGISSIGMNKINLLFPRVSWRPSAIVCSNSLVMRQNQDFFAETEIPTFLSWKGRWFMRRACRQRANFFHVVPRRDFAHDIEQGVGMGGTVTYIALQFAYYMGADPVILFGVDHSFADKGPAHKVVRSTSDDVNHFDPNYFGSGTLWQLPDLDESERGYHRAQEAFTKDGRVIYDATIGGRLRIFPRVSVEEAKRLCGIGTDERTEQAQVWA